MNWIAIREELRQARHKAGMDPGAMAPLAKSTVYRVEDVSADPEYTVSLDTIEAWLVATTGEPVGAFLMRIHTQAVADLDEKNAEPVSQSVTVGVEHVASPVSLGDDSYGTARDDRPISLTLAEARLVQRLARILNHAALSVLLGRANEKASGE